MNNEEYPLLPSDRYLAQMLGISDEEYADFKAEARKRRREGPSPLVVNEPISTTLAIISIVASVISIGLTIIASFFKPKPGRPAQLKANDKSEDAINAVERYAPRVGFDAAQDIARIGQTIPLVFAKREVINAGTENEEAVGGVRITCPLIWSQIQSYGGNQLLRAIFLVSEGQITSVDTNNFAIGSNVIGSYLLSEAGTESRLSVYLKKGGGTARLNSTHLIAGRAPSNNTNDKSRDPGAESTSDIFTVNGSPDFCSVSKPTTQTTFGLYAPIGNNLGFRVNPVFRPAVNAQLVPKGDEGDAKVKCDRDIVSLSQRKKYKAIFSTRSGLINGSVGSVGSTCTYKLYKSSDKETDFSVAVSAGEWEPSVSVGDPRLFLWGMGLYSGLEGTDITNQQIKNLLSISNKTVDSQQKTITATATFNITAAAALFDAATKPGTYDLKYKVEFLNDNGDDEVSLEKDWVIQVKVEQETNYYWQDNSTASDAEWSYDPATETLTKVSGGSVNVDGDIVIDIANTNITLTFDGGSQATSNLTTGLMTRTLTANYADEGFHQELAGDVASTISSKQRGWDDSIIAGELYKVGSAICICASRTEDVFQSEAEFDSTQGGKEVEATFKTIRAGETAIYTQELLERSGKQDVAVGERKTGTSGPHIHRIALGEISTSRACEKVEIGIKSVLGIRVGGLCNFKDTLSFDQVDNKACLNKKGNTVSKGDTLKVDVYQSGVISCSVERFSFFRISYREAGTTGAFTDLGANFGVRGITQQNQFNGISFNMGSRKRWTFRFEPLSGWEIRNQKWSGPLYILDAKLSSVVTTPNGIASFRGQKIWAPGDGSYTDRNSDFWISISRRNNGLGLGHLDADNFVDGWGKLAEQFIYEEVAASTQGPEHEIVYVNEIVSNTTTPLYDNLAIIGLNIRSSAEWQQFSQFSCYVTGGIDNTHLFPEILKKLLLDTRYGLGHAISPSQIDDASFTAATAWCSSRGYYFDGVISERQNIRQWAADVAATMLLIFGEANGKFFLRPAVPFDGVQIKGLFTADNVLEGTYQMQYLDLEDRLPIQVSIKYREERDSDNPTSPGIFPTEREMLIREAGVAETEKIEQIDVSDYVTRRGHAIDVAKFVIRMRRLPTHGIKFQTTYDGLTANLAPGDYIRCAIDSTYYDDFNNGVVSATGSLTSTQTLTDGTYDVFAWDGSTGSKPVEVTLTVSGGGTTASPTGIIFSVQNVVTSIRTYQIESLGIEENGAITIEAVHMPTDEMTAGWDSETAWVIQE